MLEEHKLKGNHAYKIGKSFISKVGNRQQKLKRTTMSIDQKDQIKKWYIH